MTNQYNVVQRLFDIFIPGAQLGISVKKFYRIQSITGTDTQRMNRKLIALFNKQAEIASRHVNKDIHKLYQTYL